MNQGKLVFSQLMAFLPLSTLRRCVAFYRGNHKVKNFSCMDQFLTIAFAQLTYRESLRDIELNLRAQTKRLYHMGLRCKTVSRNMLANATRPLANLCRLCATFDCDGANAYAQEPLAVDLATTVYAFDATIIDLCLSVYPWAPFRQHTTAVKKQIRIVVCTYVLIGIAKKHLHLPNSLHETLQILSLTIFETAPINQLLVKQGPDVDSEFKPKQLALL